MSISTRMEWKRKIVEKSYDKTLHKMDYCYTQHHRWISQIWEKQPATRECIMYVCIIYGVNIGQDIDWEGHRRAFWAQKVFCIFICVKVTWVHRHVKTSQAFTIYLLEFFLKASTAHIGTQLTESKTEVQKLSDVYMTSLVLKSY